MSDLKTLDEHNQQYSYHDYNAPVHNGIACPFCGGELWDTSPMKLLLSDPPQKNIHCDSCDYTGYRIA